MPDDFMLRVQTVTTGWGGAPGLNTFYFATDQESGTDNDARALNVADRVRAFWFGARPPFPSNWTATVNPAVDVINADQGDLVSSHVVTPPAAVVGTTSGPFGPQVAMVCANLITPGIVDGKRVRGRAFIGPLANTNDFDGTPSPAMIGAVQNGLTALIGGTLNNPNLVVWSRRKGVSLSHPTGLGGSMHLVNSISTRDSYAILRSRRQ